MNPIHQIPIDPKGTWLVKISQKFLGPFDREHLKEILEQGELSEDTEFYPSFNHFFKLSDHKQVFNYFPELLETKGNRDLTKTLFITKTHFMDTWYQKPLFFLSLGSLVALLVLGIKLLLVLPLN